ncbi:MAG TPA: type II secretion system protein [Candidatus Paceibacterota bacterium]
MKRSLGFTLIEVMVVIAIVAILASIVGVNVNDAGKRSRDADRQSDLRMLQSAIELYKNKYGRYPDGCNGPGAWSGQIGTTYDCPGGSAEYILELAPEFIPALPKDPKLNGASSGYVYAVNSQGTVYKVVAKMTVESNVVTEQHPMRSCDINPGMCDQTYGAGGSTPNHCDPSNTNFQRSFAVWGGFEPNPSVAPGHVYADRYTEAITCDLN